jgi:hypothetical protein
MTGRLNGKTVFATCQMAGDKRGGSAGLFRLLFQLSRIAIGPEK